MMNRHKLSILVVMISVFLPASVGAEEASPVTLDTQSSLAQPIGSAAAATSTPTLLTPNQQLEPVDSAPIFRGLTGGVTQTVEAAPRPNRILSIRRGESSPHSLNSAGRQPVLEKPLLTGLAPGYDQQPAVAATRHGSVSSGSRGVANGGWGVPTGSWGVSNGSWGVPNGSWGVSNGSWGVPNGSWGVSNGSWGVPNGSWGVSNGSWGAPNGSWGVSSGSWGARSGGWGVSSGSWGVRNGSWGVPSGSWGVSEGSWGVSN